METSAPPRWLLRTIRFIDTIGDWSGKIFAWLIVPMIVGVSYEVFVRYVFNAPTIWAYDVTYMLYGSHFMLGAAYTLSKGGHVRTDFFYANWSQRTQGWVDAVSYLLFFFPKLTMEFLGDQHVSFGVRVLIPIGNHNGLRVLAIVGVGEVKDHKTGFLGESSQVAYFVLV